MYLRYKNDKNEFTIRFIRQSNGVLYTPQFGIFSSLNLFHRLYRTLDNSKTITIEYENLVSMKIKLIPSISGDFFYSSEFILTVGQDNICHIMLYHQPKHKIVDWIKIISHMVHKYEDFSFISDDGFLKNRLDLQIVSTMCLVDNAINFGYPSPIIKNKLRAEYSALNTLVNQLSEESIYEN